MESAIIADTKIIIAPPPLHNRRDELNISSGSIELTARY